MRLLTRFYRNTQVIALLLGVIYGWLLLTNIWAWNKAVYMLYAENSDRITDCGLLFQRCSLNPEFIAYLDLFVIDGLWCAGTACLCLFYYKLHELFEPKSTYYSGVHMIFKHPMPANWEL